MIHFEWPWLALALPLPWLVRALLAPAASAREAALRVPALSDFVPGSVDAGSRRRAIRRPGMWIAAAAWLFL
ncbi:MAG TPA: BatB protein, partial [Gammaproteobacteria bacterium]